MIEKDIRVVPYKCDKIFMNSMRNSGDDVINIFKTKSTKNRKGIDKIF